MKPLLYLTLRSTFNGIKRALTSGRRLISLLFVAGYYLMMFVRPFESPSRVSSRMSRPVVSFPDPALLDPLIFTGFVVLTVLLSAGVFGYKGGFRPADVDVLFPTPVSAKVVMVFRLIRDYLLTLLMPLFFAVLGWRGTTAGINALFRNFPEHGGYITRAAMVSWLLVALAWVAVGYAASLFVNRSDLRSDRNRLLIGLIIGVPVLLVAGYVTIRLRADFSWENARAIAEAPLMRFVFPTATAATMIVMAPITGSLVSGGFGLLILVTIIAIAMKVALGQVGWMYDQAAARGFDTVNIRALQRKGDTLGMLAQQARQGKLKQGRVTRWIAGRRAKGAGALLWKEALLQARTSLWQFVVFAPIALLLVALPLYAAEEKGRGTTGILFLVMQAFGVFTVSMSTAQSGFIELLRRVDVLKPLPFRPMTIVLGEIAGKVVGPTLIVLMGCILGVALQPEIWPEAVTAMFIMPALAILLVSMVLMVTVLFPDVDDPAQRGFRNLITLFGFALTVLPGLGVLVLVYAFKLNPMITIVPILLINLGISVGLAMISGNLYSSYNPSE